MENMENFTTQLKMLFKKNAVNEMLRINILRFVLVAVLASVWILASGGIAKCDEPKQGMPKVSYRFLVDPMKFRSSFGEFTTVPEFIPESLDSPSVPKRLMGYQALLIRRNAGIKVPPNIQDRIKEELNKDQAPELEHILVSLALKLDMQDCKDRLLELARKDSFLASQIEPVVCKWDSTIILAEWRSQLSNKQTTDQQVRKAVKGLGQFGSSEDVPLLKKRLATEASNILQIEIAQSIGLLQDSGLEPDADAFHGLCVEKKSLIGDSLAIGLLSRHRSEAASKIIADISELGSGEDAAHAIHTLIEVDPKTAIVIARKRIADTEANVRKACISAIAQLGDLEDLSPLVASISDPILGNREAATMVLIRFAEKHPQEVVDGVRPTLKSKSWQGIEQSILLLSELNRKECIPDFFELLDHPKPDVFVTAAWGLRVLVVQEEDLAKILDRCKEIVAMVMAEDRPKPITNDDFHALAHMVEALGEQRYAPAGEFLSHFIPSSSPGPIHVRCSAIWGIGRIYEGNKDCEYRKGIEERMMDFRDLTPESIWVRTVCAFTLGRIGNPDSLAQFKQLPEPDDIPIGQGRVWAVKRIEEGQKK